MAVPTVEEVQARAEPAPAAWTALAPRDGETKKAYAAFVDYALMGPGRSLQKLRDRYRGQIEGEAGAEKPPTRRLPTLEEWSAKFAWQKRIEAWVDEQRQADQALWEARRRALREADWEAGEALRILTADILAQAPQFLKTTRKLVKGGDGAPDREVITIGIDIAAMLKALAQASELQRQAADLPQAIDVTSGGESIGAKLDLSGLSIEQLTALARSL